MCVLDVSIRLQKLCCFQSQVISGLKSGLTRTPTVRTQVIAACGRLLLQ